MTSRWSADPNAPRGTTYDRRWEELAAQGKDIHGEAAFVDRRLGPPPQRILDAGCGTGRVAIELARRGYSTVGVDLDEPMLAAARAKAPELTWVRHDLSVLDLGPDRFDAVVMAGNVMIFVASGTEATVLSRLAGHVRAGGLLIAGFQVRPGGYGPERMDTEAGEAGLVLRARYSSWDDDPYEGSDGTYQVSVHERTA